MRLLLQPRGSVLCISARSEIHVASKCDLAVPVKLPIYLSVIWIFTSNTVVSEGGQCPYSDSGR